jgi:hypothetical protein
MKKSLHSDSKQFHQINKWSITSHLHSLNTKKKDHDIWRWQSRSWFGTNTKMWQG